MQADSGDGDSCAPHATAQQGVHGKADPATAKPHPHAVHPQAVAHQGLLVKGQDAAQRGQRPFPQSRAVPSRVELCTPCGPLGSVSCDPMGQPLSSGLFNSDHATGTAGPPSLMPPTGCTPTGCTPTGTTPAVSLLGGGGFTPSGFQVRFEVSWRGDLTGALHSTLHIWGVMGLAHPTCIFVYGLPSYCTV